MRTCFPKLSLLAGAGLAMALSGCTIAGMPRPMAPVVAATPAAVQAVTTNERDCLMRAMYFESNRSSEEGLLAVGTVVMNRVGAPGYAGTICGVVSQPNQFAAGIMSKPMTESSVALVGQVADRILAGERHPQVAQARHFHQAGLTFGYRNMHYVLEAGGNAFYERR